MNHTLTAPAAIPPAIPAAGVAAERTTTKLRPGLVGGLGGLVFAGTVIAQNAIRSGFPMNDATTQDVMRPGSAVVSGDLSAVRDSIIDDVLAGEISDATRSTVARATQPPQVVALLLGSPEFQKR